MKDLMPIMASFPEIKKIAEKHGVKAEYIPVVGAIEFIVDDIPIGITHDGVKVKDLLTRKYQYIKPWLRVIENTKMFLESFNGFFNERKTT